MRDIELGEPIGTGKEAEVYEWGGAVLKLYRTTASKSSAFREAATLAIIEASGLPVPKVQEVGLFGGRWGLIMSRAAGRSFGEVMTSRPERVSIHLDAMVTLQRQIHAQSAPAFPRLKAKLSSNIGRGALLAENQKQRLLLDLAELPDGDRLCHGDFHPFNILGSPGQATIVDWLDASCGDPLADVCRSYVLMHHFAPDLANAYVATYAKASGEAPAAMLKWLPCIAAARLAEGVPGETDSLMRLVEKRG